jgi:hypothetical protein
VGRGKEDAGRRWEAPLQGAAAGLTFPLRGPLPLHLTDTAGVMERRTLFSMVD